ncbi:MBL fold metallo-hydrolase [Thioalkalivibrio sp. ALE23]|uniref:MBL fold metallo-hydrolase n=1 Tax=Thioalkalivibrio sp. ALE23 TaxID=1265495 RepID=UPI0004755E50|nr:MBL fold metallo-hydrolase [Thioalkalivibrio sp. ALE23]
MLQYCSLGSGSGGNALVVRARHTCVMIDCGFSAQEAERRLARAGLQPDQLDALLITHEHGDHIGAAGAFSRRHGIPVYASHGTLRAARDNRFPSTLEITSDSPIEIRDLRVIPFTVPHDSREPTQFTLSDGHRELALMTDAGHVTPHMVEIAARVDGLLLECNHEPDMLQAGPYPERLKERIRGGWGHLPNHAARDLLRRADNRKLRSLIGMHLSTDNNHPDHARNALAEGVGAAAAEMELATQEEGFSWREL